MSPTRQKILLLLFGGLSFGYSFTPGKQWKVLKRVSYEWKKINKKKLKQELRKLYGSKMIKRKENSDGSCSIILTEKGRLKILTYHFEKMRIKGEKWDKKWRMVIFDIPEKLKSGRNALRNKIKDEIDFVIEFFGLREYVRFGILESIDNELHLKKIFKLS